MCFILFLGALGGMDSLGSNSVAPNYIYSNISFLIKRGGGSTQSLFAQGVEATGVSSLSRASPSFGKTPRGWSSIHI